MCQELRTSRTRNLATASSRGCRAGSSNSGETVIGFAPTIVGRKAAPFCRQSARCHCAQNRWLLAGCSTGTGAGAGAGAGADAGVGAGAGAGADVGCCF